MNLLLEEKVDQEYLNIEGHMYSYDVNVCDHYINNLAAP